MEEKQKNPEKKPPRNNIGEMIILGAIIIAIALITSTTNFQTTANYLVGSTNDTVVKVMNQNDFFLNIAQGIVINHTTNFKFGRNPEVGTTEEVVWDLGGPYIFLNTSERLNISSSSILDNGHLGLDGAWNIIVSGLDGNFSEIEEMVTLNGTSTVTTTQSFLRTNRALILQSGVPAPIENTNEGDILIEGATTGTDQAAILEHNGQTLMLVYTIPAGKTGYVTGLSLNSGQGKQCFFRAKVRNCAFAHCTFSTKYSLDIYQNVFFGDLQVPFAVPEKLDIVLTAQMSSTPTATAGGSLGIILIEN